MSEATYLRGLAGRGAQDVPAPSAPPGSPRPSLLAGARADLEQAELFLLSLERETARPDLRAAYLLGLAEAHLANLIERLREVAR